MKIINNKKIITICNGNILKKTNKDNYDYLITNNNEPIITEKNEKLVVR